MNKVHRTFYANQQLAIQFYQIAIIIIKSGALTGINISTSTVFNLGSLPLVTHKAINEY